MQLKEIGRRENRRLSLLNVPPQLPSLARRPAAESGSARSASVSYFLLISVFNDSCQTNYLKINRTDLRQVVRVGRTTDVDVDIDAPL